MLEKSNCLLMLLFPQCFTEIVYHRNERCGVFCWLASSSFFLYFHPKHSTTKSQVLTTLSRKGIENIVRKTENAVNQYFVLFSIICDISKTNQIIKVTLNLQNSVKRYFWCSKDKRSVNTE